jgi:uncharacterized protein (TIGR02246 family)
MRRILTSLAVLATIAVFARPGDAQQSTLRDTIEATNQKFMEAFAKGDAAALAGMYTTDGEALPPNGDVVRGRDAIQKMWQSVIDAGIASAKLTTREVESGGDFAWESGTYEMSGKDGASLDRGKYIVVWKRAQGGRWMIHRDIWNTNQPAKS